MKNGFFGSNPLLLGGGEGAGDSDGGTFLFAGFWSFGGMGMEEMDGAGRFGWRDGGWGIITSLLGSFLGSSGFFCCFELLGLRMAPLALVRVLLGVARILLLLGVGQRNELWN